MNKRVKGLHLQKKDTVDGVIAQKASEQAVNTLVMETNNTSHSKFLVAVDCIIFGFDEEELKLLVIKRDFQPERGKWSLMGGFLRRDETLDMAADRVLHELTGLHDVYMEQVNAFSAIDRDPAARTISVAYCALINIAAHSTELTKKYSATWFSISEVPKLIYDHDEMVKCAIEQLRYKTSTEPIGFELLPEKFTMRQLQKLYETILDEELDKRNFTRKINSLDVLVKLKEKDKGSSRKGSFLYRFDQKKYMKKLSNGFSFKM